MKKTRLLFIYALFALLSAFTGPAHAAASSATYGIPVGKEPNDIAINPDTNMAVVTTEAGVSIVDLAAQRVISKIDSIEEPQKVAIDSGLNYAVVIGDGREDERTSVSVIDLNTITVIAKIPFRGELEGIAVNPVNHTAVLISGDERSSLIIMDIQTGNILSVIPLRRSGFRTVAIDPGLGLALVSNERDVSVIDLAAYKVIGTLASGKKPGAIAINPETHLAAIANEMSNSLTVINLTNWETADIKLG